MKVICQIFNLKITRKKVYTCLGFEIQSVSLDIVRQDGWVIWI